MKCSDDVSAKLAAVKTRLVNNQADLKTASALQTKKGQKEAAHLQKVVAADQGEVTKLSTCPGMLTMKVAGPECTQPYDSYPASDPVDGKDMIFAALNKATKATDFGPGRSYGYDSTGRSAAMGRYNWLMHCDPLFAADVVTLVKADAPDNLQAVNLGEVQKLAATYMQHPEIWTAGLDQLDDTSQSYHPVSYQLVDNGNVSYDTQTMTSAPGGKADTMPVLGFLKDAPSFGQSLNVTFKDGRVLHLRTLCGFQPSVPRGPPPSQTSGHPTTGSTAGPTTLPTTPHPTPTSPPQCSNGCVTTPSPSCGSACITTTTTKPPCGAACNSHTTTPTSPPTTHSTTTPTTPHTTPSCPPGTVWNNVKCAKSSGSQPTSQPSSGPGPNPSDNPTSNPGSNPCYDETTGQPTTPLPDGSCQPGSRHM